MIMTYCKYFVLFLLIAVVSCMGTTGYKNNSNDSKSVKNGDFSFSGLGLDFEKLEANSNYTVILNSSIVASKDIVVKIKSNNTDRLSVDNSCTIPQGESTCSFEISAKTVGDVNITAKADNYRSAIGTIKIIKNKMFIEFDKEQVVSGSYFTGSVRLDTAINNPLHIIINSSNNVVDDSYCDIDTNQSQCSFKMKTKKNGNVVVIASSDNDCFTNSNQVNLTVKPSLAYPQ